MPSLSALLFGGALLMIASATLCLVTATRSQRKTRDATSRYESIINTAVDAIILIDEHGIIRTFNPGAERMFGYTCDEAAGQNVRILMSDHDGVRHDDHLQRYDGAGMTTVVGRGREILARHKSGRLFPVDIAVSESKAGSERYFTGIIRDISHYKQTEEALRISEDRLARSQRFANIGTWDWNILTGAVYWSERIGPLFGYGEKIPETTYENFLAAVYPDDRELVINAINDCLNKGKEYRVEHRVIWPDGEIRWLLESGDVIRDPQGTPQRMLGVVQDITRLKQVQHELVQARNQAEKANRAKSEFLSSMSHELRTPMNVVLGFAQLLESDPDLTSGQRESIREIKKAGDHLLHLINDVLDLAKIESGTVLVHNESVTLKPLLDECVQYVEPLAAARKIAVRFAPANIGKLAVTADAVRLKQVLLNLLSNAVKYNREMGSIEIQLEIDERGFVRVFVGDTGPGIPPEKLPGLFQPFNRLGAECSDVEGSGIGLVIAKRLIESMGGKIGLANVPGQGCRFWITVPLSSHAAADVESPIATYPPLPPMNALYIEDNPGNMNLLRAFFEQHYPQILLDVAASGGDGLRQVTKKRPDIVLLDLNLSDGSGLDVVSALQTHPDTTNMPIIVISAHAASSAQVLGQYPSIRAYISKPIDFHQLAQSMGEAVENRTDSLISRTDQTSAQSTDGGETGIPQQLRERFEAAANQYLARIDDAFVNRSPSDLVLEANRLGTAATTFDIPWLRDACYELASAARATLWNDVAHQIQAIKQRVAQKNSSELIDSV